MELILINVYIPPLTSSYYSPDAWVQLEIIVEELTVAYTQAIIILLGDFNAKLGPSIHDLAQYGGLPHDFIKNHPKWYSRDKKINRSGISLASLILKCNLQILGGKNNNNNYNYVYPYTFHSSHTSSALDFICVSTGKANLFSQIKVLLREESDHQPVCVKFLGPSDLRPNNRNDNWIMANTEVIQNKRLAWTKVDMTAIANSLKTEDITNWNSIIQSHSADWQTVSNAFTNICGSLKEHLVTKSTPKGPYLSRAPWFDKECQLQRTKLRLAMRRAQGQHLVNPQLEMLTLRREYKKLIKTKKKNHTVSIWSGLECSAKSHNSAIFWHTVAGILKERKFTFDIPIPAEDWENYYSHLFASTEPTETQSRGKDLSIKALPLWPPVTEDEIRCIINNLKTNKAPGEDYLPAELFKTHLDWWAPLLAGLFTHINNICQIPVGWKMAIVVPVYKKGNKKDPGSYRPISLIDIVAKIYARYLLNRAECWEKEKHILVEEQAGFRQNRSTIDNCFVLNHTIAKYVSRGKQLYAAFIDLSAAFDTVNRETLWKKLTDLNMEPRLLALIKALYTNTFLKVRFGTQGAMTNSVETYKGVRQGCILAPLLFSLYVNDLPEQLKDPEVHMPKLCKTHFNILLYADDMILLSYSQVGLRRLLRRFNTYCHNNALTINKSKSKIMVFGKRHNRHRWFLDGESIEQVCTFTYLGIVFSETGSWLPHHQRSSVRARVRVNQLLKLTNHSQPGSLDPLLKVYKAKVTPMLLYGAEVWGLNQVPLLEQSQSQHLRSFLGVHRTTPAAAVRAELGVYTVDGLSKIRAYKYWIKLIAMANDRLPKLCLLEQIENQHQSSWLVHLTKYISSCGLPILYPNLLEELDPKIVAQRVLDIEGQKDIATLSKAGSLKWLSRFKHTFQTARYLKTEMPKHLRRVFTRARFEQLDTMVKHGRFNQVPYNERFCICGASEVEDIAHVLFSCELYKKERHQCLGPYIIHKTHWDPHIKISFLLAGQNPKITHKTALFLFKATQLRIAYLESIGVNCAGDADI
ncbi:ras-GEF domain-containing family member 1A isoform X1 [Anolis carolinensis]|uniref:ras-GEF domain-containing family member 1A isoform X1 n=1 Tax=Anolis carolinensis TaxID=28377 RepID=UPI002F2B5C58